MSANLENSSGHRTGKGQFSFQRAISKNVRTTIQLCSFHMLESLGLKSFKLDFNNTWTKNFQIYKLGLEKVEEPEIKLSTFVGSWRKQRNWLHCFIDYAKAFDCMDHTNWKILQEMGILDHLTCFLRNLYQVKKQQLEPDLTQWTGSKLGKEYIKAVYCHSAYLTYMQSTSCKMPGWMNYKLESWLPGEKFIRIIPYHLTEKSKQIFWQTQWLNSRDFFFGLSLESEVVKICLYFRNKNILEKN